MRTLLFCRLPWRGGSSGELPTLQSSSGSLAGGRHGLDFLDLWLGKGIITASWVCDDVDEYAQGEVHRRSAAKWRGYIDVPSNERRHDVFRSATVRPGSRLGSDKA